MVTASQKHHSCGIHQVRIIKSDRKYNIEIKLDSCRLDLNLMAFSSLDKQMKFTVV